MKSLVRSLTILKIFSGVIPPDPAYGGGVERGEGDVWGKKVKGIGGGEGKGREWKAGRKKDRRGRGMGRGL